MITATLYTDPGCPWAYSENPALRVIEWRYGDQIDWKLVLIGLTERSEQYVARGYTPLRGALGQLRFRRYGMQHEPEPKPSVSAPPCGGAARVRAFPPRRNALPPGHKAARAADRGRGPRRDRRPPPRARF